MIRCLIMLLALLAAAPAVAGINRLPNVQQRVEHAPPPVTQADCIAVRVYIEGFCENHIHEARAALWRWQYGPRAPPGR